MDQENSSVVQEMSNSINGKEKQSDILRRISNRILAEQLRINRLQITNLNLSHIPVRKITIKIKSLLESSELKDLEVLSFNDCALESLGNFPKYQKLTILDLANNKLGDQSGWYNLIQYKNILLGLAVENNNIYSKDILSLLSKFQKLQELVLKDNPIDKQKANENLKQNIFNNIRSLILLNHEERKLSQQEQSELKVYQMFKMKPEKSQNNKNSQRGQFYQNKKQKRSRNKSQIIEQKNNDKGPRSNRDLSLSAKRNRGRPRKIIKENNNDQQSCKLSKNFQQRKRNFVNLEEPSESEYNNQNDKSVSFHSKQQQRITRNKLIRNTPSIYKSTPKYTEKLKKQQPKNIRESTIINLLSSQQDGSKIQDSQ